MAGFLAVFCVCGLYACKPKEIIIVDDGRTQEGHIGFINALSSSSEVFFTHLGSNSSQVTQNLSFANGTGRLPSLAGTYAVRMGYLDESNDAVLLLDVEDVELFTDHERTYIAMGTLNDAKVVEIFNEEFLYGLSPAEIAATSQDPEVQFVHTLSNYGSLTFHIVDENAPLGSAALTVTLNYGEYSELLNLEASSAYRMVVTPEDNHSDILYDSGATPLYKTTRTLVVAMNYYGPGEKNLQLKRFSTVPELFTNEDFPIAVRVINLIADVLGIDVFLGSTNSSLGESIPFQNTSFYKFFDADDSDLDVLNVTPEFTANEFIHQSTLSLSPGNYYTIFLSGNYFESTSNEEGNVTSSLALETRRPIDNGQVSLRIIHASASIDSANIYLLAPGQPIEDSSPLLSGTLGSIKNIFLSQGEYDLVVTSSEDSLVVIGPERINLNNSQSSILALIDSVGGGPPVSMQFIQTAE